MQSNLLVIDANSLLYAAQDAPKLTCNGQEVQAIYGFIRKLRHIMTERSSYMPLVLWDGRAKWRFDLWPQYKGNRRSTPDQVAMKEAVKAQRPEVMKILATLGVTQMVPSTSEADDLAAHIVQNCEYNRVLLVTGDRDWWQLINERVYWLDVRREGKYVNHQTFVENAGFANTRQFVHAKALKGDTSDNIPGVGKIGEAYAKKLFEQAPGVRSFLKKCKSGEIDVAKLPKCLRDFAANETPKPSTKWGEMPPMQAAFVRNMKLMDLSLCELDTAQIKRFRKAPDLNAFAEHLMALNFISLLQEPQWADPFVRSYEKHRHSIII